MTETSRFVHKFNLILTHSDEISIYCGEKDSSIWSVRAHQDPLDCFGSWFICWNRSWRARRMMRFGAQRRCGVWTFDVTCMILWHSWQIQFKGVGVVPPHHTSRLGCGDQVKIWISENKRPPYFDFFWPLWEREILGQSKKLHIDLGPWSIGGYERWYFFSLKSDSWEHFFGSVFGCCAAGVLFVRWRCTGDSDPFFLDYKIVIVVGQELGDPLD